MLSQRAQGNILYINAVNSYSAAPDFIKPGYQRAYRGLSSAGRTDKRNAFSGGDIQIKVRKHLLGIVGIPEAYILKSDISADIFKLKGSRLIGYIRLAVNYFNKPFNARHSALELFAELNYAAYRCEQG